MKKYRVVWVNLLSPTGKPRRCVVQHDSKGTQSIEAVISRKYGLAGPGLVLVLETKEV